MQKYAAMSRRFDILTLIATGILIVFVAVPQLSWAAKKIPKDLTLTETGDKPPVVFSHKMHITEQKLECKDCHVKVFQMKAGKTAKKHGKLTMEAMREGKFCGTCHNGERAFSVKLEDSCVKCHSKK